MKKNEELAKLSLLREKINKFFAENKDSDSAIFEIDVDQKPKRLRVERRKKGLMITEVKRLVETPVGQLQAQQQAVQQAADKQRAAQQAQMAQAATPPPPKPSAVPMQPIGSSMGSRPMPPMNMPPMPPQMATAPSFGNPTMAPPTTPSLFSKEMPPMPPASPPAAIAPIQPMVPQVPMTQPVMPPAPSQLAPSAPPPEAPQAAQPVPVEPKASSREGDAEARKASDEVEKVRRQHPGSFEKEFGVNANSMQQQLRQPQLAPHNSTSTEPPDERAGQKIRGDRRPTEGLLREQPFMPQNPPQQMPMPQTNSPVESEPVEVPFEPGVSEESALMRAFKGQTIKDLTFETSDRGVKFVFKLVTTKWPVVVELERGGKVTFTLKNKRYTLQKKWG